MPSWRIRCRLLVRPVAAVALHLRREPSLYYCNTPIAAMDLESVQDWAAALYSLLQSSEFNLQGPEHTQALDALVLLLTTKHHLRIRQELSRRFTK
jgi:hypothetical protein